MTLYEVLGLSEQATPVQIKAAHRRAVKTHHPDVGGDARKFEQVQRAYFTLSDPDRRERYDKTGLEDDPAAATEEQLAESTVSALIVQCIGSNDDLNKTDIVAVIRNILVKQKLEHEDIYFKLNLRAHRIEVIRFRLRRKEDNSCALPALLAERERDIYLAKSKEQTHIRVLERALILLEDYIYILDPTPAEEAKIWLNLKP